MSRYVMTVTVYSAQKKGLYTLSLESAHIFSFDKSHTLHAVMRILASPDIHIVHDSTQVERGFITEDV